MVVLEVRAASGTARASAMGYPNPYIRSKLRHVPIFLHHVRQQKNADAGRGRKKNHTPHTTPRVHSDDTDEFVCESVRRFFKSLSARGDAQSHA